MSKKTKADPKTPKAAKTPKAPKDPAANLKIISAVPLPMTAEEQAEVPNLTIVTPGMASPASVEKAKAAKGPKAKKAKAVKEKKPKKLSALDAAAQVLGLSDQPMNCPELIEAMARRGLWESPNGQTPHATLYAAMLREINTKGKDARFKKTGRGTFSAAKVGA